MTNRSEPMGTKCQPFDERGNKQSNHTILSLLFPFAIAIDESNYCFFLRIRPSVPITRSFYYFQSIDLLYRQGLCQSL